jgi:Cd2+/Zn2+-exporting ATPase
MGGVGSDAAIEAADIVIMDDMPSKVPAAIEIAKKTRSIAIENIVFSLAIKVSFLILGALGCITLVEAIFADVGVAVIAILNSIRTLRTSKLQSRLRDALPQG